MGGGGNAQDLICQKHKMMKKKNEDEGGVYYEIWIWKDQITFLSSTKNNCISFWIIFLDLFFETIHICTLLKNGFFPAW